MLYTEAKQYLLDKLKAAGLKSNPYTTQKALEKSQESHIGAVLFDNEDLARNGAKRIFRDETDAKKKRRKVFDRTLTFTVITITKAQRLDQTFTASGLTISNDSGTSRYNGHITAPWYEYELKVVDRFGNPDGDFPPIPGVRSKEQCEVGNVVAVAMAYGDIPKNEKQRKRRKAG